LPYDQPSSYKKLAAFRAPRLYQSTPRAAKIAYRHTAHFCFILKPEPPPRDSKTQPTKTTKITHDILHDQPHLPGANGSI
jgi:hypothetical protein